MTSTLPSTQDERRLWLIRQLAAEQPEYAELQVPVDAEGQRQLLRALMNVRPPLPVGEEFLAVQDAYLAERVRERGVTRAADLPELEPGICLWQGDITTLAADAIVNAANSQMLGCFVPNHRCIDNAIHSFAGVQLRLACATIMAEQGRAEATGGAKITPGFNLPAAHVIHTVGPIVGWRLEERDRALLRSCYRSCLELAQEQGLDSIAFCCISTGEFHFPNDEAARIAVDEVRAHLSRTGTRMRVVFNVFKQLDYELYRQLLGRDS